MTRGVRLTSAKASLTPEGLLHRKEALGISYRQLAALVGRSHVTVQQILLGKTTSAPALKDIDRVLAREEKKQARRGSK